MTLMTVDALKRRFKIEDDDSDEVLSDLLTEAIAAAESYIGRAIYDPTLTRVFGPVRAEYARIRGLRVSDNAPNNRTETSWYDKLGRATNLNTSDPVQVNGAPPLSTLPDYPRWEAICNIAIAALVAESYYRPNSAELVSREGGVMVSYGRQARAGVPDRVARMLKPIRDLWPY